jgi:hypothetical protein
LGFSFGFLFRQLVRLLIWRRAAALIRQLGFQRSGCVAVKPTARNASQDARLSATAQNNFTFPICDACCGSRARVPYQHTAIRLTARFEISSQSHARTAFRRRATHKK